MNIKIKELPEDQRPCEKCMKTGAASLTDTELLAAILRTGTREMSSLHLAGALLASPEAAPYPGLSGLLHLSEQQLMKVPGIGKVKAVQLTCIGELSRRIAASAARPTLSMSEPETIARYYMERLRHADQEYLYLMMLDAKNHLIGEQLLTIGTASSTLVTPREVFIEALKRQALGIVLIHNHPSGDPTPSNCDLAVTDRVARAGEVLGIELLDHIVIGDQRYFSFREEELINGHAV